MKEKMCENTRVRFSEMLASSAPVPGSAYAGALAAALGHMVDNLTVGKKKYAAVEEDVKSAVGRLKELRLALIDLVDGDAESFLPMSEAYSISKDDPNRDEVMENA